MRTHASRLLSFPCIFVVLGLFPVSLFAQTGTTLSGLEVYQALKAFTLSGETAQVDGLVLKRDRAEMTFSGTFYFESPVAGQVRGAVFIGKGNFRAEPPPIAFERENVKRMLDADLVESDFGTAILRFTDETPTLIGQRSTGGAPPDEALELAREFGERFLRETGANIASRLAVSILNREQPGFFLAQFDKGKRKRFTFLMDYQGRIPSSVFTINGGEKGLIFTTNSTYFYTQMWMAFYSLEDLARRQVPYSDAFDIVHIDHFTMDVDVTSGGERLQLKVKMDGAPAIDAVRAVSFEVNEGLGAQDSFRLKKSLRLQNASFADSSKLDVVQEDWEIGLTVFFPAPRARTDAFSIVMEMKGDAMLTWMTAAYPRETTSWYPHYGYLTLATYELTFRHKKRDKVAAVGVRVSEDPAPDDPDVILSRWKMDQPVAFVTFGVGPFERHNRTADVGGKQLPLEFNSMPGSIIPIDEGFVLQEMSNSIRFFNEIFGPYPYPCFSALFHPRDFGQAFPTLLLLPVRQKDQMLQRDMFSFIAHETAHEWWGHVVRWRSYRDQWLSEGFAEYSGVLFTGKRVKASEAHELIDDMHRALKSPTYVDRSGSRSVKIAVAGPIILGHRNQGASGSLIYYKGALVLRMLHFLFTDPATGNGQPFFDMMSDFARQYSGKAASTEDFFQVASEHFAQTPLARKYGLKDLGWFFDEWVYQAHLPSYRLEYEVESQSDGTALLKGTVFQENAPEQWYMPLPLVLTFGKDQVARGTVQALGPSTPVNIKLPKVPLKVELDPDLWVLSEKTTTKKK